MAATFRSLRYRNARLFFSGLMLSNIGTWMQFTATAILVDRLTGRTTAIGVLTALQFLPMLFLGAWAGAVADQRDRRRLSMMTQGGLAIQAVALAVFDLTGTINLGIIYVLTFVLGVISAIDNPARRGFVTELVPEEDMANAISLNTATMTGSRIFGPAIAALLVGPIGTGWLFTINAVSFLAILGSLFLLDESELHRAPLAEKGGTPIRDGLRFVRDTPALFAPFVVFAIVATFGFNHNVVFPRMSREIWGDEFWFGIVLTTLSIGSMLGSLLTAGRRVVTLRWMVANGLLLGIAALALAWSGRVWLALVLAVPLGLGGAGFVTSMNAITQQLCPPDMRGRILALTAVAFLGSYPIGGPITGLVGDYVGLEWSLGYGALISLSAVFALIWWALGRDAHESRFDVLRNLLGASTPVAPSPSEHP
ncbi:MAG: MFS transporter [Ilumatobacter sp.]|uniref:MFS transporter n=1 Tax=Ilumatobacter sp. TaxID=1967498 RepID=UPI00260BDC86|nr:MFS transporter [Ilumatobacter sp.]MDJ0767809.1 MFS transporter [Ilumatobacter sp.]